MYIYYGKNIESVFLCQSRGLILFVASFSKKTKLVRILSIIMDIIFLTLFYFGHLPLLIYFLRIIYICLSYWSMNFTQQNRGFTNPSFSPNNPTNFNNQYNPNANMNGPYTGSPITFNQSNTFDTYVSYIKLLFDQIRVYHLNTELSEIAQYVNL